jgi:hypothetical protein
LRVLFDMSGFHGWEASAAWEVFKFGMKPMPDIERIAMVGEKRWQHGITIFCKPFIKPRSTTSIAPQQRRRGPDWVKGRR